MRSANSAVGGATRNPTRMPGMRAGRPVLAAMHDELAYGEENSVWLKGRYSTERLIEWMLGCFLNLFVFSVENLLLKIKVLLG